MIGLLTEREWHNQRVRQMQRPDWYGAQYVICTKRSISLFSDRSFMLFLLLLACTIAMLLPVLIPSKPVLNIADMPSVSSAMSHEPRQLSAVRYTADWDGEWTEKTFAEYELNRGKMLFLNETHPLPNDIPPPNTYRIASYGRGMIPLRDLHIKSGRETIDALQQLFEILRQKGLSGLGVSGGTVSAAQQRNEMLHTLRAQMKHMNLKEAIHTAIASSDWPGTGEMLLEYSVEMQLQDSAQTAAAEQILQQTVWRVGFVQTEASKPAVFRLRYVGKAHATAMTYLDLDLRSYLLWLHEKGTLTVLEGNRPRYLIICKPVTGTHVQFSLPAGAEYDASADNMGYAVVACTLP